jgi:DNA-binding response OmpR family regulator
MPNEGTVLQLMDQPCATDPLCAESCLLVEDDPVLRRVLRGHLARRGFKVAVAGTVEEATLALDGQTFSHLITDAILPDGAGLDLVLQARDGHACPLVIMISGDESVGHTVSALHDPRTRFLLKPFSMLALDALLVPEGPRP